MENPSIFILSLPLSKALKIQSLFVFTLLALSIFSCNSKQKTDPVVNKGLSTNFKRVDSVYLTSNLAETSRLLDSLKPKIDANDINELTNFYYYKGLTSYKDTLSMNRYADSALAFFEDPNRQQQFPMAFAKALMLKSDVYVFFKKYDKALENYFKIKSTLNKTDDPLVYANYITRIAHLYYVQNLFKQAANYHLEAFNVLESVNGLDPRSMFHIKQGALNNAGFSYEKAGKTWYASYAVANREPTRSDFTDNPITEIPRPERLNNVEAGLRAKSGNFSYNANFYYMGYKDQLILTGQINDVGAYIRENVESSYRAGIELDGAYQFSSAWTLGGNLTLSQNKIREFTEYIDDYSVDDFRQETFTYTNTDIAFSPNVVGSAIIEYKPSKNLSLNWLSKYVGRQFLDNTANEARSLDAFFTNDLRISYSATPRFFKGLEVNLLINNIFNELYEPNGYTFSYFVPGGNGRELVTENFYYPQAGTNFLLGLRMKF